MAGAGDQAQKKALRMVNLDAMWNPLYLQVGSVVTASGFPLRGGPAHSGQRQIPSHKLGIHHLASKEHAAGLLQRIVASLECSANPKMRIF